MSEMTMDWINFWNLILGALAFGLLFSRTWQRRGEYPREVIYLLLALESFVIALLATSAELLTLTPPDEEFAQLFAVSVLITVVKVGLLWVLWATKDALYRTGNRHVAGEGRNADELDVNQNFADHPQEGM